MPTNKVFVFDVDGTLTPSRTVINPTFAEYFIDVAGRHPMYLVTGSDRAKTLEQVTEPVYNSCKAVFQCSGNERWHQDKLIKTTSIDAPQKMFETFDYWLGASRFEHKTGNHVEVRSGLINFSIVGRNATRHQRAAYVAWDHRTDERRMIAATLNNAFGDKFSITVAGDTGLDITYLNAGKHQIVDEILEAHPGHTIEFYGDKTNPGGNDYSIAQKIHEIGHTVCPVDEYMDTEFSLRGQNLQVDNTKKSLYISNITTQRKTFTK